MNSKKNKKIAVSLFLIISTAILSKCSEKNKEEKTKMIWGTAISGFQADMGPGVQPDENSDWWIWMHDEKNEKEGLVGKDKPENGPAFWKNYKTDIDLAKELGTNYFRYSIEWSRIFPEPTTDIKVEVVWTEDGYPAEIKITDETIRELEKKADENNFRKYREILEYARSKGLKILLTLNHFTLPKWIHDPIACRDWFELKEKENTKLCFGKPAGWLSTDTVIEFTKYSAFLAHKFGDIVDLWGPMNEPIVISTAGYLLGKIGALAGGGAFPPGAFDPDAFEKATENIIWALARSYDAIAQFDKKDADSDGKKAEVVLIYNIPYFEPASETEEDKKATEKAWDVQVFFILDAIVDGKLKNLQGQEKFFPSLKKRVDIIGINYYNRMKIKYLPVVPEKGIIFLPEFPACPTFSPSEKCPYGMSEGMLEIYPPGIYEVIKKINERYRESKLPILITENGIADSKDERRPEFIREHIKFVKKAIEEKIEVLGYFYWALIDNLEWNSGYSKRFGLIEVDYSSAERKRTPRKSFYVFKEIIENFK